MPNGFLSRDTPKGRSDHDVIVENNDSMKTTTLIITTIAACVMGSHAGPPFNNVDRVKELSGTDWVRIDESPMLRHSGTHTGVVKSNNERPGVARPNRPLNRRIDASFSDPRWHQVLAERFDISRSIPTSHFYTKDGRIDYSFINLSTKVPNAWRFTERSKSENADVVEGRAVEKPSIPYPKVQPSGPATAPVTTITPPTEPGARIDVSKPVTGDGR